MSCWSIHARINIVVQQKGRILEISLLRLNERMEVDELLLYLIFFMLIAPTCTLLHEVGHGLGAISTSKANVHIYLGKRTKDNKENFKLGRLHFHIQWALSGFAQWGKGLDKRQRAVALVGGPIMSLLLALLFGLLAPLVSQGELRQLMNWTTAYNLIQFIVTIIPITYPRWMGGFNGLPSDGLQLLRLLREKM